VPWICCVNPSMSQFWQPSRSFPPATPTIVIPVAVLLPVQPSRVRGRNTSTPDFLPVLVQENNRIVRPCFRTLKTPTISFLSSGLGPQVVWLIDELIECARRVIKFSRSGFPNSLSFAPWQFSCFGGARFRWWHRG
jgi:hypothetical protein